MLSSAFSLSTISLFDGKFVHITDRSFATFCLYTSHISTFCLSNLGYFRNAVFWRSISLRTVIWCSVFGRTVRYRNQRTLVLADVRCQLLICYVLTWLLTDWRLSHSFRRSISARDSAFRSGKSSQKLRFFRLNSRELHEKINLVKVPATCSSLHYKKWLVRSEIQGCIAEEYRREIAWKKER
jgi:hypothetical protein